MKYAQIQDGLVHWVFDADEPPSFHPDVLIIDITGMAPLPVEGLLYQDGEFVKPAPPTLTPEEAFAQRDALLREAAVHIAPLQDADDLEIATPEERAALLAWKQYRVALNRIDQQPTFPQAIDWPQPPA
ncbi:tail fiber assembly protein [Achromobacter insolitus]|uniref:tail fiber assembly protein n=1 Tax=Achromobacter insolitus TaxID=217204 RepID=UPI000AB83A20|nr:tail fiber assembly protein [Achromobacter insolitus]AVG38550.1 phage tail protein [Achromobacter insolitus]